MTMIEKGLLAGVAVAIAGALFGASDVSGVAALVALIAVALQLRYGEMMEGE